MLVHNLGEPFKACHALLQLFSEVDQPINGRKHHSYIQDKSHQVVGLDPAHENEQGAACNGAKVVHFTKQSDYRVIAAHHLVLLHLAVPQHIVDLIELLFLIGLPAKRLHFPDSHQRILDIAVHIGNRAADLAEGCLHFHAVIHPVEHHDRKRDEGNQGKRNTVAEHEYVRAENRCHTDDQILGGMVGGLGDLEQVVRDPAHHMTGLGLVKVSKREFLQMGEQLTAHIRLHPDTQDMAPRYSDILADGLQDVDEQHEGEYDKHMLEILFRNLDTQQLSGQRRKQDGERAGQDGHPDVQKEKPLVGAVVCNETLKHPTSSS